MVPVAKPAIHPHRPDMNTGFASGNSTWTSTPSRHAGQTKSMADTPIAG